MEYIKIDNVGKIYGDKKVATIGLENINLTIDKGEFIAVMGPSGCGKSTLLNCISTIDVPTSGLVLFEGRNIVELKDSEKASFRAHNLSFIFQSLNLLPTLTCRENIGLPLVISKQKVKDKMDRINEIAKILHVDTQLDKYPYELSGGQQQRVAICRSIVQDAKLILADEPTGALDSNSSRIVLENLRDINKQFNVTMIMVTHDPNVAKFANKVVFMKDGKISRICTKDEFNNEQLYYQEIIKTMANLGDFNVTK